MDYEYHGLWMSANKEPVSNSFPHVVIIGAGFGGIQAALHLGGEPVRLTLLDRENFHLFQPLLYQVATAGLSPAQIAVPIRSILRRFKNIEVALAQVEGIDVPARKVLAREVGRNQEMQMTYDYLIVATGSKQSYFGHEEWSKSAPPLKSILDATRIRRKILTAFEEAEMEKDTESKRDLLRFVVVGGGATGVELAGSLAELARRALVSDFRHIDPKSSEIHLIEAGPRLLSGFPPELSARAERDLIRMGVKVRTNTRVESLDDSGVQLSSGPLKSRTVIWAAGVSASPAARWLGVKPGPQGRVSVGSHLQLPDHPEVFVIGDTADFRQDGKSLPGLAPVAMQMGRFVARRILETERSRGKKPRSSPQALQQKPFHYVDKGQLATIGRRSAVASLGRIKIGGAFAWFTWAFVHIFYLIGFRNRVLVLIEWAWSYATFQRGARLITPSETGPQD